jgi:hypothetical protein
LHRNLDYNMKQYLIAKARNILTGQTVMAQDLTGARLELRQRSLAEDQADQLAAKMTRSTGAVWRGFVEVYSSRV